MIVKFANSFHSPPVVGRRATSCHQLTGTRNSQLKRNPSASCLTLAESMLFADAIRAFE
jgi:hypothetical protein